MGVIKNLPAVGLPFLRSASPVRKPISAAAALASAMRRSLKAGSTQAVRDERRPQRLLPQLVHALSTWHAQSSEPLLLFTRQNSQSLPLCSAPAPASSAGARPGPVWQADRTSVGQLTPDSHHSHFQRAW